MKRYIIGGILALAIFLPFGVNAQNATQSALNAWRVISGYIVPNNSANGLKVPALGSTGNPCLSVGSTGIFATSTCGSGGSATTTINSFSGPDFIFATGTPVTGLGLNITGSGSTIIFQPTISTSTMGLMPLSTGTTGYVTRWLSGSTVGTGTLLDNGTVSGVNATSSTVNFNIQGTGSLNPFNVSSSTGTSLFKIFNNGRIAIASSTANFLLDVNGVINGQIQDSGGQVYNVKSYGAVCDGVTDDAAAINSAISAIPTATTSAVTRTLWFPGGVCLTKSNVSILKDNIIVEGNGTTLRASSTGFQVLTFGSGSGPTVYSNYTVRDLTIDMNNINSANSYGLVFAAVQHALVENVRVTNAGVNSHNQLYFGVANGSSAEYARDLIVKNSTFDNNYGNYEQILFAQARDVKFVNNTVASSTAPYGLLQYGSSNILLEGNTFRDNANVRLDLNSSRVIGNDFLSSQLVLTGTQDGAYIVGNTFDGTSDYDEAGIVIQAYIVDEGAGEIGWRYPTPPFQIQSNATIISNYFKNCNPTCIFSDVTSAATTTALSANDLTITKNTFEDSLWQGIDVRPTYLTLENNTFKNSGQLGTASVGYNMVIGAKYGLISNNQSYSTSTVTRDFFIDDQYTTQIPTQDLTFQNNNFTVGGLPYFYNGASFSSTQPATVTIKGLGNRNFNPIFWTLGNFGIGTTAPTSSLFIQGTTTIPALSIVTSTGASLLHITPAGNVGIGTTTPAQTLVVIGDIRATGALYDSSNSAGSAGNFLMSTATGYQWTATSTLGFVNLLTAQNNIAGVKTFTSSGVFASTASPGLTVGNGSSGYLKIGDDTISKAGGSLFSIPGINLGVGSAAVVSASFGTLNTGLFGTSNTIDFSIAGTEKMKLDSSGNLGIGTTSPLAKLSVYGTAGNNPMLDIASSTNVSVLRITPSGNVGIGTTSPAALLDINSNSFILETAQTPVTSTSTCTTGMHAWDASYVYVCTSTNNWKRSALSSW